MDKDYIEVKIPILDSVDEMKVVKTFTQEQLWYVCAIAKAFEKSEQRVKKQKEVIEKAIQLTNNFAFKILIDNRTMYIRLKDLEQGKDLLKLLKEVTE